MPMRGTNQHLANLGIGAQVRNPMQAAVTTVPSQDGGKSASDLFRAKAKAI
jgi:hypothetical protein